MSEKVRALTPFEEKVIEALGPVSNIYVVGKGYYKPEKESFSVHTVESKELEATMQGNSNLPLTNLEESIQFLQKQPAPADFEPIEAIASHVPSMASYGPNAGSQNADIYSGGTEQQAEMYHQVNELIANLPDHHASIPGVYHSDHGDHGYN